MSENQKPAAHPEVHVWKNHNGEDRIAIGVQADLTPDEAVKLGFALFEHGLDLKGRMRPLPLQRSEKSRTDPAGQPGSDEVDAPAGDTNRGENEKNKSGDLKS